MGEVRQIWNYHELFMMLKLKSPLYEIIAADWVFPGPAASDMIRTSKPACVKYE